MTAPTPTCAVGGLSPLPQRACFHPSRAIRYIFLDGCRNVTAPHGPASTHKAHRGSTPCHPMNHVPSPAVGCWPSLPSYHPMFLTLPIHPEKPAQGSGHSLTARRRLPVFQQLCGEDVSATAPGDTCLQTSSHEQKEQPNAKAPRESKRGRRMRKMKGCSPCDKA